MQQQQQQQNFPDGTDQNGAEVTGPASAAQLAQAARRSSQRGANGHEGVDGLISRTGTPSMYSQPLHSFMVDDQYQSAFHVSGGSEGRPTSPTNGERGDVPPTHEQLIAQNSSLKTRVSELEVINELFRGRLSQLEQQEAAARRGQEVAGVEQTQLRAQLEASQHSESQLQAQLEDSHRRENNLKRRLDELELELKEAQDEAASRRPVKKPRVDEAADDAEEKTEPPVSTPAEA